MRSCWRGTEPSITRVPRAISHLLVDDSDKTKGMLSQEHCRACHPHLQGSSHKKQDAQMLQGSQCFGAPTAGLPGMGRILDLPG